MTDDAAVPLETGCGVYGPNTAAVQAMRDQAARFDERMWRRLGAAYADTFGVGEWRFVQVARDFAFTRFQEALKVRGLREQFDTLWLQLQEDKHHGWATLAVHDAVSVTMLEPFVDAGPLTRSDFDVLMAPWKAAVQGCVRSRLLLALTPRWPYPADDGLWQVVDAALADPQYSD